MPPTREDIARLVSRWRLDHGNRWFADDPTEMGQIRSDCQRLAPDGETLLAWYAEWAQIVGSSNRDATWAGFCAYCTRQRGDATRREHHGQEFSGGGPYPPIEEYGEYDTVPIDHPYVGQVLARMKKVVAAWGKGHINPDEDAESGKREVARQALLSEDAEDVPEDEIPF